MMGVTRRAFTAGSIVGAASLACRPWGVRVARARQATPAADGLHITLAGPTTPITTLDPALVRDSATMIVVRQLFRGLLALDSDMELRPALAESVIPDAEATVFAVRMRAGATFHDGRPIVADDVAASFARALNPETAGGDGSALAGAGQLAGIVGAESVLAGHSARLSGVEIRDEHTFTIALSRPDAAFPEKLASVAASVVDTTATGAVERNGSGPFRLSGPASFELLTMTRLQSPYEGPGTVSSLSFLVGASASSPANLLQAGTIDIASGLPADEAALLADPASGAGSPTIVATPDFSLLYLALSPSMAPLDDIHIRSAIQIGFPWARLAEAAGASVQPARGVIAPGMLGRTWEADMPGHDLDVARAEVARSRF
ncbi:MAG: ABC transporter substrate-binding protein, partial [Thermomicrobiales bacterium]